MGVLLLDCVCGYGTHDELMRDCSVYREISVSQMGDGAKGKTEEVLA